MADIRSAFVVANDTYWDPRLRDLLTPTSDATALARVLSDPAIGAFDVQTAINEDVQRLRMHLSKFFADRGRSDFLLLYISCHGLRDQYGRLYLAASDTLTEHLAATAISSEMLREMMDQCRSQTIVLVLDCCFSGAFVATKSEDTIPLSETLGGRGRIIMTSSRAVEYSLEAMDGDAIQLSLFTKAFVEGLQTGDADLDADGYITVDEIYDYVYRKVREVTSSQTPMRWANGVEGRVVLARNPRAGSIGMTTGSSIAQRLVPLSRDSDPVVRQRSVHELTPLLYGADRQLAALARKTLTTLSTDPEPAVAKSAAAALGASDQSGTEGKAEYTTEPMIASDYWTTSDELDYAPYAQAIAEFILHGRTRPPLTIGIKAPCGGLERRR